MSISDTISKVTATNPIVGVAAANQSTDSALLAGFQTGDTSIGALLGGVNGQVAESD